MEIKKAQIADLGELEALFREHYQFLCTAAYYVIGDEEAAKDVVQDFFFYCWKKRDELTINNDFKNYAFRAIKNASLNYLKYARRTTLNPDLVYEAGAQEEVSASQAAEEDNERNRALWAAVGRLPEQRRLIFLLSNEKELTYLQIAGQLNISVNTVKTQIRLAYQFLREECRWLVCLILIIFNLEK